MWPRIQVSRFSASSLSVSMSLSKQAALDALNNSEVIFTEEQVLAVVSRMAYEINSTMAALHPLVLSVMGGAVVFTGQLLPKLNFPLDFDYVHVSRYGNNKQGGEMHWKVAPQDNVRGRVVLVIDDILDEGETLNAIRQAAALCHWAGGPK